MFARHLGTLFPPADVPDAHNERGLVQKRPTVPPAESSLGRARRNAGASERQPVRIIIADAHPIFRDGLRRLLETRPDLQIVGETGDGSKAAALVCDLTPDILLLGVGGAGSAALDVIRTMATCGSVAIILIAASVDTPEVANAFQLGARGVVPKDSAAEALFQSIDSVMDGQYWIGGRAVANVS